MSSDASEGTHVGHRVRDRYRIVRELGSGALGTVCLAEDEATAQQVAVRFLPRAIATNPNVGGAIQGLGRSIAAGSSAHPGLVRVMELGETKSGPPFAVMELLEGRLLSDILFEGKILDVATARRWALELGASVEALHNAGLVHGRIRPRNVMILPDGRVKLMDVEMAGLLNAPLPQTLLDVSPVQYLAPEQIRRGPATEKTDVYALALIIYEMFSGSPTFRAASRDAVIAKQLTEPPPSISRGRAVPAAARAIVMQALEKDPELRPWMHEILNELWGASNVAATRGWNRAAMIGGSVGVAAASLVAVGMWMLLGPRYQAVRAPAPRAEQGAVAAQRITSPPASAGASSTRIETAVRPPAPVMVSSAIPTAARSASEPANTTPTTLAPDSREILRSAAPVSPAKVPPETARVGSASALAVEVQPRRRTYRVGWLDSGRATVAYQDLVKQALVGYPRDVAFEYRSADGQSARLNEFANELVQLKVDVVFAVGDQAIGAAKQATSTIPIVMVGSDAASAESSANATGVTYSSAELARSWLSLLKEIRPPLARVAVVHGADAASRAELARLHTAAANAGAKIKPFAIQDLEGVRGLFAGPPADRVEAIIVPGGPPALVHLPRIVDLAGRARLPTVYGSSEFVDAGGLLAYGPSTPAMYRRAGSYIGKILGPTNPRDLPIEHPSRFELVVNLKTARALGITLPQSLVLRADRVLQ